MGRLHWIYHEQIWAAQTIKDSRSLCFHDTLSKGCYHEYWWSRGFSLRNTD